MKHLSEGKNLQNHKSNRTATYRIFPHPRRWQRPRTKKRLHRPAQPDTLRPLRPGAADEAHGTSEHPATSQPHTIEVKCAPLGLTSNTMRHVHRARRTVSDLGKRRRSLPLRITPSTPGGPRQSLSLPCSRDNSRCCSPCLLGCQSGCWRRFRSSIAAGTDSEPTKERKIWEKLGAKRARSLRSSTKEKGRWAANRPATPSTREHHVETLSGPSTLPFVRFRCILQLLLGFPLPPRRDIRVAAA